MRTRTYSFFGGLILGLSVCSLQAPEMLLAEGAQSPVEIVRARNQAVKQILSAAGDSLSPATKEELKDVINGFIDFRELSRRALGRYWDERTEQEKADFVRVLRELIRNSSVKKLGIYRADSISYRNAEIDGDTATVVTLAHKGRKSVEMVYEMHRVGDEWMAHDIVIDQASTVRTYRDSFYREIASSSYNNMYARLVRKLEEETEEGP